LEAARQVRADALKLRAGVALGAYDQSELARFWQIAIVAPDALEILPSELSERAGFGRSYFASVVRDKRRPKLANMLAALTAVVEVADERIGSKAKRSEGSPRWIPNSLHSEPERLASLQSELALIIAFLRQSNSLADHPEVDAFWRANLIELLETALCLLKAPLVETTLIRRSANALKQLGKFVGKETVSGTIGFAVGSVATTLAQMIAS
jgi:hypothetical protein